jgi:N-acetylneuraminic acid mutarotase
VTVEGAPSPRAGHTAVWTGTEMIVWGGAILVKLPDGRDQDQLLNTGGRYNPTTHVWTPTTLVGAPSPRVGHTAVWTGTEMIIWGGGSDLVGENTGARYDPSTDIWTPMSTVNAPTPRRDHTAVWTGSEMIVWGGIGFDAHRYPIAVNSGARYNPQTDTWMPLKTEGAPDGRFRHTAIYTGEEMIIWGGSTEPTFVYPLDAPFSNTGGRYSPTTESWSAVTTSRAPEPRYWHTAVWTGTEMIIFGGFGSPTLTAKRYNPELNAWLPVRGAPDPRDRHTAVWTGTEMIVWGGRRPPYGTEPLNTGARYDPTNDAWRPTSLRGAPEPRRNHTVVWTGSEMVIWGGLGSGDVGLNTGARYKPYLMIGAVS